MEGGRWFIADAKMQKSKKHRDLKIFLFFYHNLISLLRFNQQMFLLLKKYFDWIRVVLLRNGPKTTNYQHSQICFDPFLLTPMF
jgi:hypothetical protein